MTGLGFKEVLQAQQVVTRALGIWGLVLLAEAFGLPLVQALAAAAICSLGVVIAGPTVLTVEYEPTPRAFAVPLIVLRHGTGRARQRHGGVGRGLGRVPLSRAVDDPVLGRVRAGGGNGARSCRPRSPRRSW